MSTVVVVGGGIAGLAAAWELTGATPAPHVVVLEASPRTGGKLETATVAGHTIDVGAESVLARRPEALRLFADAGLEDAVVHPTAAAATIWSRGSRRPLPPRTLMGIPSDPDSALGILTADEVDRLRSEVPGPPLDEDVSVGDLVAARLGPAVVDRLVEPLLAGVYAGHSRRLSLQATVPALWAAVQRGDSLVETARRAAVSAVSATAATAATAAVEQQQGRGVLPPPVFAGYRGGLGAMAAELTDRLRRRGVEVRTGSTVRELRRTTTGWALTVGSTRDAELVEADAVVVATPAAPTARLLEAVAPPAAAVLAGVDYASMAIVTLALPRSVVQPLAAGSGFLVPPTEPVTIKAATFSAAKWQWVDDLDPDVVLLRTSVGRAGEVAVLQRDDADLVAVALSDLGIVLGADLGRPVDAHVRRWGGALPQYAVGHLGRVASVQAAVASLPGLELAGAAYEGVGVPACIGSGRAAAERVLTHLRALPPGRGD